MQTIIKPQTEKTKSFGPCSLISEIVHPSFVSWGTPLNVCKYLQVRLSTS